MLESGISHSPRISRETRRLLIAAGLALVVLWQLARIRYTDGTPVPSPVPLLGQLAPPLTFVDLAAEVGLLNARIEPAIVMVPTSSGAGETAIHPAIRIDREQAVAWLPATATVTLPDARVVARDGASGLTILRLPGAGNIAEPASSVIVNPDQPRYLAATMVWRQRLSLRPTFVAGLEPVSDPAWTGPVLRVPPDLQLSAGAFVFTMRGDLAGLVAPVGNELTIVPSAVVRTDVARLRDASAAGGGELGLEVQPLTPALATAAGASAGVIVTRVDPQGPAAALRVGDVIEAVGGDRLDSGREWDVYAARIGAGMSISLQVNRRGTVSTETVTAASPPTAPPTDALGLTMQLARGAGIRLVRVDRRSAADRAGLAAGDVITMADSITSPTPAQLRRAFAALQPGGSLMVAVTREPGHHIVALVR